MSGISCFFHAPLLAFVPDGHLPVAVKRVAPGKHPSRSFHDHNFSEIAVIESGHPTHILDGRNWQLEPGDVLIVHPGAIHAYDNAEDMGIVNVVYDARKLSLPQLDGYTLGVFRAVFPEAKSDMLHPVLHLDAEGLKEILSDIDRLEEELLSARPAAMLGTFGRFIDLLVHLARHGGATDRKDSARFQIGDAIALMNRRFAEPLHVEELTKASRMSRRNFFRHFKAAAGCSPVEYLIRLRLQHAAEKLLDTRLSIGEIAIGCGFYDGNFFCKKFREAFAMTPKDYRKQNSAVRF